MKRPLPAAVLLLAAGAAAADVAPASPFTDHMVLQQDLPLAVWGTADPGEKVTVHIDGKSASTEAGEDGKWRVDLPPMKADGRAHELTIRGRDTIVLKDVKAGEVWLCSGQSNMGRPVGGEAAQADHPDLRLFHVGGQAPRRNDLDETLGWVPCSPGIIVKAGDGRGDKRRGFSQVAYHFGLRLHEALKVPVGLIQSNCGGSTAKDWTPLPGIEEKFPYDQEVGKVTHTPGLLYHLKMRPLVPFPLRGAIWYQGEDDGRNPDYARDLQSLIESWRGAWRREDLPFYFAQIAQTTYASGMLGVWEGQQQVMRRVPHTGLAVSNDIYDGTTNGSFKERMHTGNAREPALNWPIAGGGNPHPTGKELVARRLAEIALVKTYGQPERVVFGPMIDSHRIADGKIVVTFSHAGGGLATRDGKDPDWFEISDGTEENRRLKYVPARVRISGPDTVEVFSPDVPDPKFVRFAWHALARHNLINKEGLPAVSFRTDTQPGRGGR